MKKRWLAGLSLLLLAVVLATVFAVGASGATLYTDVYVGGSGTAHYADLKTALDNVAENGTVHIEGTYALPSGFSWPQNKRHITITGGTLDLSAFAAKNLIIGDHATFTSITLTVGGGKTSIFANGNSVTVAQSVTFTYGTDAKIYFYGGAASGSVSTTNLSLYAGIYEMVYGGGLNSTVSGDTHVTVGGTVNQGKVDVNVHNSSNYVYGGGEGASSQVGGDTHVTFTGNAMAMQVIGGSNKGKITGDTNLLFSGGNSMGIYGGSMGINTQSDAYVTITGGQVQQVFGANNGASFTGNVYLRVLGGKVTRRIYGGCYNNLGASGFSQNFGVDGQIYLTLDANAEASFTKDGYADHGIFACSRHNDVNEKAGVVEKGVILYTSSDAQNEFSGKLGYKNMGYGLSQYEALKEDTAGSLYLGSLSAQTEGTHTVAYTVSGNTITEKCTSCSGGHSTTVTLSVADPDNCVYTGSPVTATLTASNANWKGEPIGEISHQNNVNPGEATATATHYYGTLTLKFTIQNAPQTAPAVTKARDESICGKGDGLISGLTTAMEWSTDGQNYAPVTDAMIDSEKAAGTYYFRYPAKTNYDPSPDTVITIGWERMLTVTFRAEGNTDIVREVAWNATLTDIPAVPTREGYTQTAPYWNVTDFTGICQDMTVDAVYTVNVYTVSLSAGTGYTLTATTSTLNHGDSVTITLAIADGYSRTESFAIAVNGTPITLTAENTYALTAEEDITVTVSGVADVTAPTATVTIGNHSWTSFPTELSFSLTYKAALGVAIAATDTANGALTVEYVLSSLCLTESAVRDLTDWQAYTIPVTLGTQAYTVVYFRVTDAAGNASYFATEGLIYKLTVTFAAEGSDPILRDVTYGEGVSDIPVVPTRTGYTQVAPYWSISDLSSVYEDLTVTAIYTPNVYSISLSAGTGYTLTATKNTVTHGESISLTLTLASGYSRTDAFAFVLNGTPVALDAQGVYTLTAESDLTVTVTGVADLTAPTATVTVGGQSWTSFPSALAFTLYHNSPLTASISAFDSAGGTVTVEFMKTGTALTLQNVQTLSSGWRSYTGPIALGTQARTVIYFRVTDNAGNTAYFATTGIVYDTEAPVVDGIETGGSFLGGATFTATDAALDTVLFDGAPLTPVNGTYSLPNLNKTATLTVADKAGNVTTVTLTLRAVWTVTFVADGQTVATVTVPHGEGVASVPTIPTKAGYTATAPVWDKSTDSVTADLTVTAVYTADPIVTPPSSDNTPSDNEPETEGGSTADAPNASNTSNNAKEEKSGSALPVILAVIGGVAVAGTATAAVLIRKKT